MNYRKTLLNFLFLICILMSSCIDEPDTNAQYLMFNQDKMIVKNIEANQSSNINQFNIEISLRHDDSAWSYNNLCIKFNDFSQDSNDIEIQDKMDFQHDVINFIGMKSTEIISGKLLVTKVNKGNKQIYLEFKNLKILDIFYSNSLSGNGKDIEKETTINGRLKFSYIN